MSEKENKRPKRLGGKVVVGTLIAATGGVYIAPDIIEEYPAKQTDRYVRGLHLAGDSILPTTHVYPEGTEGEKKLLVVTQAALHELARDIQQTIYKESSGKAEDSLQDLAGALEKQGIEGVRVIDNTGSGHTLSLEKLKDPDAIIDLSDRMKEKSTELDIVTAQNTGHSKKVLERRKLQASKAFNLPE